MEVSVIEVALQLGLDASRVRHLIRDGDLAARKVGSVWLIDSSSAAQLAVMPRSAGRPMSAPRAWGALDLLAGGSASWLSPSARSQVRALLRGLETADAPRWRALLRARIRVFACAAHPAATAHLMADPRVITAGPAKAAAIGLNLVALSAKADVYVDAAAWDDLAQRLFIDEADAGESVIVRIPQWPGAMAALANQELLAVALAADCIDGAEPRAISAGVEMLTERVRAMSLTAA